MPPSPLWLDRREQEGLDALLAERPRSGCPMRITPAHEEAIVARTLHTKPPAEGGPVAPRRP